MNRFGSHYIYYHCTRRRSDYDFRQPSVSAADLERQLARYILSLSVPDAVHSWALAVLTREAERRQTDREAQRRYLDAAIGQVDRQLDELTRLRIRDLLTDEELTRQRQALQRQRHGYRHTLDTLDQASGWFEPAQHLVSLSRSAAARFERGDDRTKRLIVETVGSNLTLRDRTLSIDARKPFRRWTETADLSQRRGFLEDVRTFFRTPSPESSRLILQMKEIMKDDSKRTDELKAA